MKLNVRNLSLFIFFILILPFFQIPEFFLGKYFFANPDVFHHGLSMKSYFFSKLRAGELTFFYPYNLLGASYLSNPQYGVFSPLEFLYLFFNPIKAYHLSFFLYYIVFSMGWLLAFTSLGISISSAMITIILFVASGFFASLAERLSLAPIVWTGFFVWSLSFKQHKILWNSLAGLFCSWVFYAGDPILAFLVLIAGPLWVIWFRNERVSLKIFHHLIVFFVFICLVIPCLYHIYLEYPLMFKSAGYWSQEAFRFSLDPRRFVEIPFAGLILLVNPSDELWFRSLGLGFFPVCLLLIGLYKKSKNVLTWFFVLFIVSLFYLACGRFLPGNQFMWGKSGILHSWRFPERILLYAFISFLPILAVGVQTFIHFFKEKKWIVGSGIIFITLAQLYSSYPKPEFFPRSLATEAPPILKPLLKENESMRVIYCSNINTPAWMRDFRGWGVAAVASPDAVHPSVLKAFDCSWVLHKPILQFLGVSHVLTHESDADLSGLNFVSKDRFYKIYSIPNSGPHWGIRTRNIKVMEFLASFSRQESYDLSQAYKEGLDEMVKGNLLVDPNWILRGGKPEKNQKYIHEIKTLFSDSCTDQTQNIPLSLNSNMTEIELKLDNPCPSFLSIPWRFIPGWRAYINDQEAVIYRSAGVTMGLFLPKGHVSIVFEYR